MTALSAHLPTRARPAGSTPRARQRSEHRAQRQAEDLLLVEAIRGGDEDAFRRLVEKYQRPLFWIAHDILLDADEARDVVQEAFIRVHAALDRYDMRRDFVNWIYRIARNLAIDWFRRRRRRAVPVAELDGPDVAPGPSPAAEAGRQDLGGEVREVLETLPVEYRLALTLRELHGLNPREIAEVTDCSYPTARWRLHRARALFRAAWEERHPGAQSAEGMA